MFNLLESIRNPIRFSKLDVASVLIDCSVVPVKAETLFGEREICDHTRLRLRPQVEVACVIPSTDIEPRNMLSRRER